MRNFNENYSLVRALHAVVGGDTVDIYLNGNPFFYNIKFTKYIYLKKLTSRIKTIFIPYMIWITFFLSLYIFTLSFLPNL